MNTTDMSIATSTSTSHIPASRLVARKRVVLSLFLAMLLITLGAEAETFFRETSGVLSLAWPMAMLLLAIYWLRLFLSDWMRRVQVGKRGDESSAGLCPRS